MRTAVAAAKLTADADTVLLPDGDLWLDSTLVVDTDVTLVGVGGDETYVHGDAEAYRVLEVTSGAKVTVSGMTLADGYAPGPPGSFQAGGIVRNHGELTLDRVRVTRGRASSGGGVANTGGRLTITRSLIDNNVADIGGGDAGGLLNFGGGTATVRDSTIAHNSANKDAAFLSWGGPNTTTFERVTVVDNAAPADTGGLGYDPADTVRVGGSIIARNTRSGAPSNCLRAVESLGGNVESGTDCGLAGSTDLQQADPLLSGEPEDLGGGTQVYSLAVGSPALNRFGCDGGTDQRGVPRPQGGACDAGAYEHDPVRITSAPRTFSNDPRPRFDFSAPEGTEWRCRLVGHEDVESGCPTPMIYTTDLPDGAYVFRVRAVRDGQTVGEAEHAFTLDTSPPAAAAVTSPQNGATVARVVIAGTAEPLSTVWVRESQSEGFDRVQSDENGQWVIDLGTDTAGEHSYRIRVQDRAGNYSDFTNLTLGVRPTRIDSGPEGPTDDPTPTFTFSAVAGAQFECALNDGPFTPCNSPHTLHPLEQGSYVFAVRAAADEEPVTREFTVDVEPPSAPVIESPQSGTVQTTRAVTLRGFREAGTSIEIYDGTVLVGAGVPDRELVNLWSAQLENLAGGTHVLTARAVDQAGNRSDPSSPVTVQIATARITSGPQGPVRDTTARFEFTSDTTAVTFACRFRPAAMNFTPCESPQSFPDLEPGTYRFEVVAVDSEGRFDDTLAAVREFTVDTSAPTAPTLSVAIDGDAATLAISGAETGLRFECRLEGPGGDGTFAACAPDQRYARLAPGAYRLTVRAIDPAGNASQEVQRTFTVAPQSPSQPTPTATATPTPRPTETPTPQPERGETVVVRPTGGKVLIQIPPSKTFVELKSIDDIPLGATIDAKNGRVQLRFESEPGKVQTAVFYGGIFLVRQVGKVLDVKLTEALAACPKGKKASAAQSKKKPKKRKLWGDGKGSFRTTGKYSAATVRGTRWLVEDSCAGTLTRVTSGVVAVKDRKKTILVRAGKRYLAKAR